MQVKINNCFNKQKIEYSKKPYGLIGEENVDVNKKEQDLLAIKIKNRVLQVQAIKGKDKSSTTKN